MRAIFCHIVANNIIHGVDPTVLVITLRSHSRSLWFAIEVDIIGEKPTSILLLLLAKIPSRQATDLFDDLGTPGTIQLITLSKTLFRLFINTAKSHKTFVDVGHDTVNEQVGIHHHCSIRAVTEEG